MTDPQTADEAYVALLLERLHNTRGILSNTQDALQGQRSRNHRQVQQLEAQDLAAKARNSFVARILGLTNMTDWSMVESHLEAVGKLLGDLAGDEGDILTAGSGGLVAAATTGLEVRNRQCEKYWRLATEAAAALGLDVDIAQDSDFGVLLRALGLAGTLLRRIASRPALPSAHPAGPLVASAESEYDRLVGSQAIHDATGAELQAAKAKIAQLERAERQVVFASTPTLLLEVQGAGTIDIWDAASKAEAVGKPLLSYDLSNGRAMINRWMERGIVAEMTGTVVVSHRPE